MLKYEYVYCRKYDHTGLYAVLPRCARAISQESLQRTTDNAETSTRYEQEIHRVSVLSCFFRSIDTLGALLIVKYYKLSS